MGKRRFDLYIDESGNFEDDKTNSKKQPSLVGGLLFPTDKAKDTYFSFVPDGIHAMEQYDRKTFFDILQKLRDDGGHFIIFSNEERLKVVNGDVTYLNILSEGFVQLMRNLKTEFPDDEIELNALIATRQNVSQKKKLFGADADNQNLKIEEEEYRERLEEKLIIAMGRSKIHGVEFKIEFGSGTRAKKLMLADIICNTYLTRNGKKKFSDEDRDFISSLYEKSYIYSVFENATIGILKRLFLDGRYGEMMYQLCVLSDFKGEAAKLRDRLLERMIASGSKERETEFSYLSLQIGQYNNFRMFSDGIRFAENYKKVILEPLAKMVRPEENTASKALCRQIEYWTFDTDFYILTMYDHLGNAAGCEEHLDRCRKNIGAINQSWEHIDYYFRFRIRELNCMIGRFEFEEVLEKSEELLKILKDAKELFGMIGNYDNTDFSPKSELLGRVYGVRLEAYTNLIGEHPELFEDALETSDSALAEFTEADDLSRQYQYRCQLLAEVGKTEEALSTLFRSMDIDVEQPNAFRDFVEACYHHRGRPLAFPLYHYSNVLRRMAEKEQTHAKAMGEAILSFRPFADGLKNEEFSGHPWNLILWNLSIFCRTQGQMKKSDELYRQALKLTRAVPDNVTMYAFAPSMAAERLLYCIRHYQAGQKKAEAEYRKICEEFHRNQLPQMIMYYYPATEKTIDEVILHNVAKKYLK